MPVEFEEEIAWRAENGWPLNTVPYSMTSIHWNNDSQSWDDGYRPDCSGFASMCLGLPTPGTSTVGLVNHMHRIPWSGIRRGSLVMLGGPGTSGANGHVGIIAAVYPKMKTYDLIEQSGGWGPDRNRYRIGESSRPGMVPYRSNYVTEDSEVGSFFDGKGPNGEDWGGEREKTTFFRVDAIHRNLPAVAEGQTAGEPNLLHFALKDITESVSRIEARLSVLETGSLTEDQIVAAVNKAEDS